MYMNLRFTYLLTYLRIGFLRMEREPKNTQGKMRISWRLFRFVLLTSMIVSRDRVLRCWTVDREVAGSNPTRGCGVGYQR